MNAILTLSFICTSPYIPAIKLFPSAGPDEADPDGDEREDAVRGGAGQKTDGVFSAEEMQRRARPPRG